MLAHENVQWVTELIHHRRLTSWKSIVIYKIAERERKIGGETAKEKRDG